MFKRKVPLGWVAWMREQAYPKGGYIRALRYMKFRMSRVPDAPERVARGVFIGSLIGFLPLPGLQLITAWGGAKLVRGNTLAALLGTFNTNPVTTPFFAVAAINIGYWTVGRQADLTASSIGDAFIKAGQNIWYNVLNITASKEIEWRELHQFWDDVYVPYLIGSLIPGVILSAIAYFLTIPLVRAYQTTKEERKARRMSRETEGGRLK